MENSTKAGVSQVKCPDATWPWSEWAVDEQHKDGKNARQVASWLSNHSHDEKPFFIACGIQKPHVPFLAPDKYFDLYPSEEIPLLSYPAKLWDALPKTAISKRYEAFGFELGKEDPELTA